jgi:hypothetical protein
VLLAATDSEHEIAIRSSSRVAQMRRSRTFFCSSEKTDCETPSMLRGKVVSADVTHRMTDPTGVLIERYVRQPHRRPRWLD